MGGIEIVRYEPDLRESLVRLQRYLWGRDLALNRAYFRWKYQDNPYLPGPALVVAVQDGAVVGMRSIVGARWRIGSSGRTIDIPYVDDLVVAPACRGQGVSGSLVRAACASARELGFPLVLSLRAGGLTLLDSLAAGFRAIGSMEPVGLTSPDTGIMAGIRHRLPRTRLLWRWVDTPLFQPVAHRPFQRLDRRPGAGARPEIRVARAVDPAAIAELAGRLPPDDRIGHVQDRQYFEWALRNPRLDYRFLLWEADRLEGYLVLQRERPTRLGPVTVSVAAWEGTTEAVRRDLLEAAVARGRFTTLAIWTATLSDGDQALLAEAGFTPTELEARARGRPAAILWSASEGSDGVELEGRALTSLASWRLRLLDQD